MKELNNYTVRELSKIIAGTNIMSSGGNPSFVKLAEHLIKQLQNGSELEKISRIVTSELISSYGLDITEIQGIKIAEDIYSWYHE